VLKQKEAEAESLREERTQLAEQVQALAERVQALSAAERKRQELAIEVERLTAEVHDLARYREQLVDLQGEQEALVALRNTVRELQEENAQLRSQQLAQQAPPRPALPENPAGLGESLDSFLVPLAEREGYRAAVLADQQGLLIAGTGEHAKELAVVAALYDEMASKVPEDLPLSHLQEIHMVDENAVTLAVQPLSVAADRLILVSLSVGSGPDKDSIDRQA
jgi:predicted regulator of Ras-like GTPase activity (Roadblock/LC7/MglB family)